MIVPLQVEFMIGDCDHSNNGLKAFRDDQNNVLDTFECFINDANLSLSTVSIDNTEDDPIRYYKCGEEDNNCDGHYT